MKLADFHKMVGITNEEERRTYYKIHHLGLYICPECDEIIDDIRRGCCVCGYGQIKYETHD